MKTKRLYFIDAVRAFAILMMLQGHFIDTLLAVEFRDPTNLAYSIWHYFRGITAPTFFTISGLIFTYLLLKTNNKAEENIRIKKGLSRGLMLIGIGYALRIPIFRWFKGKFDGYFMVIDVLQCIGLSLLLIIVFYKIFQNYKYFFSVLMFAIATLIFISEPLYRSYEAAGIPLFFANYLSKSNGSVFTIIPWFGYMAYGAFIATIFYRYINRKSFKTKIVIGFFAIGLLLVYLSSTFLQLIFNYTSIELFERVANFNYLFVRLGNVLIIFGLFYAFEWFIKKALILKIGQKTLSIYVIHFIVLYGSFTGWGLNRIIGKNLEPIEAVFGALIFLVLISAIAIHRHSAFSYLSKINGFIKSKRN